MKKYFVKETDEVVEFGDVINVTLVKDLEDGKVTIDKELKFTEDTMDLLIEMEFIEEREVEENNLLEFDDDVPCETLAKLIEDFEALEQRVEALEKKTALPKKK